MCVSLYIEEQNDGDSVRAGDNYTMVFFIAFSLLTIFLKQIV